MTLKEKIGFGIGLVYLVVITVFELCFKHAVKQRIKDRFGTENPEIALAHYMAEKEIEHLERSKKES